MSRFAGLPEALRERSAADDTTLNPEDDDCNDAEGKPAKSNKKKDKTMDENEDAIAQAAAAATQAANARFSAVLANANYATNAALAQAMLANDKLSAEDINGFLALVPKPDAGALSEDQQREAAEKAGRDEMKVALADQQNSNIDTGGSSRPDSAAKAASVWDTAYANEFPQARQ